MWERFRERFEPWAMLVGTTGIGLLAVAVTVLTTLALSFYLAGGMWRSNVLQLLPDGWAAPHVFSALLLVLNVGAAVVSFAGQDWRRGTYWIASAVCIAMMAFR